MPSAISRPENTKCQLRVVKRTIRSVLTTQNVLLLHVAGASCLHKIEVSWIIWPRRTLKKPRQWQSFGRVKHIVRWYTLSRDRRGRGADVRIPLFELIFFFGCVCRLNVFVFASNHCVWSPYFQGRCMRLIEINNCRSWLGFCLKWRSP